MIKCHEFKIFKVSGSMRFEMIPTALSRSSNKVATDASRNPLKYSFNENLMTLHYVSARVFANCNDNYCKPFHLVTSNHSFIKNAQCILKMKAQS